MSLTAQRKQEIWEQAKRSPEEYWKIINQMHEKIGHLRRLLKAVGERSSKRAKLVKKQAQKINELNARLSIYK